MEEKEFQIEVDDLLPLRDVVFYTLRRAILTGQLKPGERLMDWQADWLYAHAEPKPRYPALPAKWRW